MRSGGAAVRALARRALAPAAGAGEPGAQRGMAYKPDFLDPWPTPSTGVPETHRRDRSMTPWVRTVVNGVDLLRSAKYNKGMAFTESERERLYLRGLLPPALISQDTQVERVMANLQELSSPLEQYQHLTALQERNERLFYLTLLKHAEELKPIIYKPTAGEAALKYGLLFRRPRGLFVTMADRGRIYSLLKNWPERNVRVIVLTDGERVSGLGDLGIQGMAIPVSKLALYTTYGGIEPSEGLPVVIDVGTDNEELLQDPFYVGLRHRRVRGDAYDELMDEFINAAMRRWGANTLFQFEDFSNKNGQRLLDTYRGHALCFNDDVQGTSAAMLGGLMAALPEIGGKLKDHTYLFAGAGEVGANMAELLAHCIAKQAGITQLEARARIWLLDSKGLVVRSRSAELARHKLPWAHDGPECGDLLSAVKTIKPSCLIGIRRHTLSYSEGALAGSSKENGVKLFTKTVLEEMARINVRPLIFALSRPVTNSECTAEEAYKYTDGRCVFTSGCAFEPFTLPDGRYIVPRNASSAYIFPGLALGTIVANAERLREEVFVSAAEGLASQVTDHDRARGSFFPSIANARQVSLTVAAKVASKLFDINYARRANRPRDMTVECATWMWDPTYRPFH